MRAGNVKRKMTSWRSQQSKGWNDRRLWPENIERSTGLRYKRAVTLAVPHAYSSSKYGTFNEVADSHRWSEESSFGSSKTRENWDELIERLFDEDESGHMVLKKSQRDD
ncbi:hypothetical protein NC651_033019 [Populus alba x Populus x berolinensis]|nr:hypothetical protein NC651_033019 [Populus alba x Populus x berolinensis]